MGRHIEPLMHVLATGRLETRATFYDMARFEQICALPVTFVMAAVQGVNFDAMILWCQ